MFIFHYLNKDAYKNINIVLKNIYKQINKYNYYFDNIIQLTITTYNEIIKNTPYKLAKLHLY